MQVLAKIDNGVFKEPIAASTFTFPTGAVLLYILCDSDAMITQVLTITTLTHLNVRVAMKF